MLIYWASFRRRLALIAASSLLLNVAMAAILLRTAHSAAEVVDVAKGSQLRTQRFSALQFAADRYQRATYDVLRWPGSQRQEEKETARRAYQNARDAVRRLEGRDAGELAANRHIIALSDQVQGMLDRLPKIVENVDTQWQKRGSTGAMQSIQQQSQPYFHLIDTLQHEIELNNIALHSATERANQLQAVIIPVTMIGLLLSLFATSAAFSLIIFRLSPSLRRLEIGVREFSDGRTRHRISLNGRDEFAQLAGSFNAMADQIEEQEQRLRHAASELEHAVEKRTADLEAANSALAAADQRRRNFFAEVSHELRTPITIIHGEAQVALRQIERSVSFQSEAFERIISQSQELRRLINDLFLIARAEAEGLELHRSEVDVGELVERVVGDFQAIAADFEVSLSCHVEGQPFVNADIGRIRQVLSAALDNAMRHAGQGIAVEVLARRKGRHVEVIVRDDGRGVDPSMLDTLLQRFRRGASTAEGSGLGLTIIRALIEAHGGRVYLANRSTGGLEVVIILEAINKMTERTLEKHVEPVVGGGRSARC